MKHLNNDQKDFMKSFLEDSDILTLQEYIDQNTAKVSFTPEDIENANQTKSFLDMLKKKGRVKNQHYVPEFYLHKFTNNEGKLEIYDIKYQKFLKSRSPKSVCRGDFFYSKNPGEGDYISQILEYLYWQMENDFALIYENLVNTINSTTTLSNDLLRKLCVFVSSSWSRSNYMRDMIASMNTQIDEQFERFGVNQGLGNIDKARIDHIHFLLDDHQIYGFAHLLYEQQIRIYISGCENNFILSDYSILELIPERVGPLDNGFSDRTHYFVLSPKILVEFSSKHRTPGKKIKRQRLVDKNDVLFYNTLRSVYGGKYMYAGSKKDINEREYADFRLNFIDKLYETLPETFEKEKQEMDFIRKQAIDLGLDFQTNVDLIEKLKSMGKAKK